MLIGRGGLCALVVCLMLAPASSPIARGQSNGGREQDKRPKVSVRAQPNVGTTPARIILTAELAGGVDDFEEYYCPTVVWEWGDDTVSEAGSDCDPYQPGVSQIKRRYTVEHIFRRSGNFKVYFHLKQKDRVVVSSSAQVQITAGARDFGEP